MLVNLLPPSNFSVGEYDVLQIPLKFCTYVQNAPQTWKFIFFCVMRTIAYIRVKTPIYLQNG